MLKLKYILSRSLGAIMGATMVAPAMVSMVSADNYVDLSSANLGTDGKLKIDGADANATGNTVNVFNTIMDKGRLLVAGVTGVLSVVLVGLFVFKAFNLAKSSDSPQERAKCINGMIFYFIGAACFGGASLFSGLFYNLFK